MKGKHEDLYTSQDLDNNFNSNNVVHLEWLLTKVVNYLLEFIVAELSSTGSKDKSLGKWKFDLSNEIQDLA